MKPTSTNNIQKTQRDLCRGIVGAMSVLLLTSVTASAATASAATASAALPVAPVSATVSVHRHPRARRLEKHGWYLPAGTEIPASWLQTLPKQPLFAKEVLPVLLQSKPPLWECQIQGLARWNQAQQHWTVSVHGINCGGSTQAISAKILGKPDNRIDGPRHFQQGHLVLVQLQHAVNVQH